MIKKEVCAIKNSVEVRHYPTEARKPANVIAMLPAYDLLGLYGSFSLPRRLPTTSAIPGKHKSTSAEYGQLINLHVCSMELFGIFRNKMIFLL